MLTVVTWLWRSPNYRTIFTAAHVNALARMVARHYRAPHKIVCVTNHPEGIDPAITIVADTEDFADIASPHGGTSPSCYRRLRLMHPDAARWFGERFVSIDLDCVITADLRPLWDRSDEFVIWRDPLYPKQYCGSMLLMSAGARPQAWTQFNRGSPAAARVAGFRGSDQAWLSYCLPGEATWSRADGVYSYRVDCANGYPPDARVVFYHGKVKPWDSEARRCA